ncbi:protein-L-isoaspartate(D-aspartate) O-methyltransferase [Candidatus Eisenbacteria bacterium]|uniref:Protein-L-isoaspartate O-methyltransferase n=1 Tax=Eiseniibacteriota bacterium TaxID=2212470 RepID=A0ABV6YPG1_UNCEI
MWTKDISRYAHTLILILFCVSLFTSLGCQGGSPTQTEGFDSARKRMVEKQIIARGIEDERVIGAMLKVPRHEFVPAKYSHYSYRDTPLPIGHDQTISQPYIVALMTDEMNLSSADRVLEVGTGSGYQAAVLAEIVADVYTVEIVQPLGEAARDRLEALGYENVHVRIGDGYEGWEENAPFDRIIVTCAPTEIPQPLVDQLKEGGIMVIPVGNAGFQYLYRVKKVGGEAETEKVIPVSFVPLTGPNAR